MTSLIDLSFTVFVIPLGLEPKTHSLEGCCSIQLSYGTSFLKKRVQRYEFFLNPPNFKAEILFYSTLTIDKMLK